MYGRIDKSDEYQRVMEAKTVKLKDQKPVIKMVTVSWIGHCIARDRASVHCQPNTYGRIGRNVEWSLYLMTSTKGSWKPKLSR